MKTGESAAKKTEPIIIEAAGMKMWVDYRHGAGDEGLTFDITVAGAKEGRARILRFDCFKKKPHYHVGKNPAHDMKDEGIEDPVRWTLDQLKTRLPSMVMEAGYEEISKRIDQKAVTDRLSAVEKDIFAKI